MAFRPFQDLSGPVHDNDELYYTFHKSVHDNNELYYTFHKPSEIVHTPLKRGYFFPSGAVKLRGWS